MMKTKLMALLATAAFAAAAQSQKITVMVEDEAPPPVQARRVALIVQNHAAPGAQIPVMALTDALTANLSGRNFQVINPYNNVGVNQNRSVAGEATPSVSAMELARSLGADGAVTVSVLEFLDTAFGTPPKVHQYAVRLAINLADAQTGATICGETIKMKSPKYTNNQVAQNRDEYLGDLLAAAAQECAARFEKSASEKNWQPTPPPPPLPPPPAPKPVLDILVDRLVAEMLSHPQFVRNYEEQKESAKRLPIAIIGVMENETGIEEFDAAIKAAGDRFRKKLFDSKLFDVKDDAMLVNFAKRIIESGNSPTENGDLMEELKQHGSPDFYIVGNLNRFADLDGTVYCKFRVTMHSLRTGKIVWEGIETITDKKEAGR